MVEEGLQELETYVYGHQNTFEQYITTRPIIDLCLATEQRTGPQVSMQRRKQDGLNV